MAFIPKDAKWYLADIVLEFKVRTESANIIHVNLTLIRANSAEEAYDLAMQIGQQNEIVYKNTDGDPVTVTFHGLRDLYVIHEALEHGSEILYEEKVDLTKDQVKALVRSKQELSVFVPRT